MGLQESDTTKQLNNNKLEQVTMSLGLNHCISKNRNVCLFQYVLNTCSFKSQISQSYIWVWSQSVQSFSHVQLFATSWTAALQASLSITNSWSLRKLMSVELVMSSSHLILCRPLLLPPSIFPRIRVFSNESVPHIRWPKYWSFGFSISPSKEYSGLIFFRMDF